MCIIDSVISSIKFTNGKGLERSLGIFSVISSIKFSSGKGAWVDTEPVSRTRLLSVPDWRFPVCKNARVLVISPALKLSAAEARSFAV